MGPSTVGPIKKLLFSCCLLVACVQAELLLRRGILLTSGEMCLQSEQWTKWSDSGTM